MSTANLLPIVHYHRKLDIPKPVLTLCNIPAHKQTGFIPRQPAKQGGGLQQHGRQRCGAALQEQSQPSSSDNGVQQPGLIFGAGHKDSWDAGAVNNPVVRCYWGDNEHRWMMWYNGSAECPEDKELPRTSIGLATSSDGVRWHRESSQPSDQPSVSQASGEAGKVLGPNADWWWHDTRHVSVSDVQIFSSDAVNTGVGVYWMFYSGGSFEEAAVPSGFPDLTAGSSLEGLRSRIGLAMSQDGRNWARIEADHHTGALFDAGEEGDWDACLNGAPQVEALGQRDMRMYYHTYDQQKKRYTVGLACSRDGFKWQKQGPIFEGSGTHAFDAKGASAHHIVKDPEARRYVMFYEAVAEDDRRSISLAVSRDGIKDWQCLGSAILTAGGSSAWDAGGVGSPCAVSMEGGRWRLYYSGTQEAGSPWQGIGLAITDLESTETFEGVKIGFKRVGGV